MKKLLLFAFAVAATVSCKQNVQTHDNHQSEAKGDVMQLSAGTGAALTMANPNAGVRVDFILKDQISLFAAYMKDDASTRVPDWKVEAVDDSVNQVGRFFVNWPASCTVITDKSASPNPIERAQFGWGTDGLGGVGVDRIYPRNDKAVAVYAYYPYSSDPDTVTVDPAKGPQVKIKLIDLGADITDVENVQPDILFAKGVSKAGADTVKRSDILAPLVFDHALAQVNFKIVREKGAAECKLRSISFTVPHSGVMNVVDGKITIAGSAAPKDSLTYLITDKQNEPIKMPTDPKPLATDTLHVLATNPLMILPMTDVEAKACGLTLTVHYGSGDPDTDTKNYRTFNVNLNNSAMKPFLRGKKNILTLKLNETGIVLEASINPWGENDPADNPEIDVE